LRKWEGVLDRINKIYKIWGSDRRNMKGRIWVGEERKMHIAGDLRGI
jgi:hypothetical protein